MNKFTNIGLLHLYEKNLTKTEIKVCQKFINYETHQEIADCLFVTLKCIKFHLSSIYKKLQVDKKPGLTIYLNRLTLEYHEAQLELLGKHSNPFSEAFPVGNIEQH